MKNNKTWPNKKTPTKELFETIREDLEMLRAGTWVPEDDSIDCTLDVLAEIEKRVKK